MDRRREMNSERERERERREREREREREPSPDQEVPTTQRLSANSFNEPLTTQSLRHTPQLL